MVRLVSLRSNLGKICLGLILAVSMASCVDKSKYEMSVNPGDSMPGEAPNSFDFSTVQKVNLSVDYSAFKTYGSVFFGVYAENPIIEVEDAPDDKWNEDVKPIYEDYTEANGKFNAVVELPAYAQHLYIATGNFFTGMMVLEADVKNGAASVVAENQQVVTTRGGTRAEGDGVSTADLSKLNLTNTVKSNGTVTNEKIYNDWKTWLGTWNSATGCPDYLLDKTKAKSDLVISEEEMEGLYTAVGNAFVSGSTLNDEYSSYPDLLLTQDSEVTFTLLGGSTCWKSCLGYYYYTDDNKPTKPSDINIIMLFPNTQDGQWVRYGKKNGETYNGIGVERGDVVQLMYYPNIANNDNTGATTKFPKGTRIGFILKTQGWAMQGNDYCIRCKGNKYYNNKYNTWCATTDGLSYCSPIGNQGDYPNPKGDSRGAKFSYKTKNGDNYTIISFEDAMDDQDFDDLIFALKPVGVFAPLPEIANKKSSTTGVYAFEDMWPNKGDYDLNDAVVNVKHEKEFEVIDDEVKIVKETFYLTTYQNYVELTSGLALTLNTKVTPKVAMKKIVAGETEAVGASFATEGNIYYLTEDFKGEIGTTYILELSYTNPLSSSADLASIQPFIYRSEGKKNWEVHIPMEAPTANMNTSYFGKGDDKSNPDKGPYFVRQGDYPFAFYLKGADISAFKETILKRENESKSIDQFFPDFLDWSISGGTTNQDWYLKPKFE